MRVCARNPPLRCGTNPTVEHGNHCVLFLTDELSRQCSAVAREHVRLQAGENLEGQDLTLISGGIVRGRILEKGTGKPLAGVGVFIDGPSRPSWAHAIQRAVSNAEGVYQMHVPPGRQHVQFELPVPTGMKEPQPLSRDITVAEQQTVEMNFSVPRNPAGPIKGRAVDTDG